MTPPGGHMPAGEVIELPTLAEVEQCLVQCLVRFGTMRGSGLTIFAAQDAAIALLTDLDHLGLCLSDLCDGTLTVTLAP